VLTVLRVEPCSDDRCEPAVAPCGACGAAHVPPRSILHWRAAYQSVFIRGCTCTRRCRRHLHSLTPAVWCRSSYIANECSSRTVPKPSGRCLPGTSLYEGPPEAIYTCPQ